MAEEHSTNNFQDTQTINYVGISKSKRMAFVVLLLVVGIIGYYTIFSNSKPTTKSDNANTENVDKLLTEAQSVAQETSPKITIAPQLPELPPLVKPTLMPKLPIEQAKPSPAKKEVVTLPIDIAPKIPIIVNELPQLPTSAVLAGDSNIVNIIPTNTSNRERRGAGMIAFSGEDKSSVNLGGAIGDASKLGGKAAAPLNISKVKGRLDMMIIQGKILDVVLETAINSDLNGLVRGLITRDTYAESGNNVIIPKGSRVIGNYSFTSKPGMYRINIDWNRLILPNGVDIKLSSTGIDELGRNGVTGTVDNKIQNVLTSSISLAALSFGTGIAASKISDLGKSTTVVDPTTGKSTTTSDLPYNIISNGIKDFSTTMKGLIERNINTTPTVHIDQGTLVKVFVNQDLLFSQEMLTGLRLIK